MENFANSIMPEWFASLGPMGWPLLLCSIVLTAVILRKAIESFSQKHSAEQAAKDCWQKAVDDQTNSRELRQDKLQAAMEDYEHQAFSGISTIKAVATISPMIGLLGTMIGIMSSFRNIAENQGPVTPSLIAEGLWQAMSTTAFGIAIAIVGLAVGFYLNRRGEAFYRQLAKTLNQKTIQLDEQREQQRQRSPVSGAKMERWDGAKNNS